MTYQEFINNILSTRGRFGCQDKYHERHHILPKCLGGTNDEKNLIDLYADEHYIAHELLAQENPHNKGLQYALWTMSRCTKVQNNDRYVPTEEQYKNAREAFSKAMSGENNPLYGKKMTDEQKQKLSESLKKSPAHRKHMEEMWKNNKGRTPPNKGVSPSKETIQKLKEYRNSKEFKAKVSKKCQSMTWMEILYALMVLLLMLQQILVEVQITLAEFCVAKEILIKDFCGNTLRQKLKYNPMKNMTTQKLCTK